MTRSALPAAALQHGGTIATICACCGEWFAAKSQLAAYCSDNCRCRAYRYRRQGKPVPGKPAQSTIKTKPIRPQVVQARLMEDPNDLPLSWRQADAAQDAALAPLAYAGRQVRVITDDRGMLWFVASDVCAVLEISNPSDALTRLDDDEKGLRSVQTPGGQQSLTTVNEPGLYSLIFGSRKPEARAFKRWVTHEVLPAIRRTGSYSTASAPAPTLPHGVHVVAKNHRHANWLWNLAVEQHVGQALMCKIARDNRHHTNPSHIQLHLPAA